MATAIAAAAGTGDVQIVSGPCTLLGWTARESAGSPAIASATLRNGTGTSDPSVGEVALGASGSHTFQLPVGIQCSNGLFLDRLAGNSTFVFYIK